MAFLTNGEAEWIKVGHTYVPPPGGGAGISPEADVLGLSSVDLHGNQITRITLTIEELYLNYDGNRTFGGYYGMYRIYGKPLAQ